MTKVDSKGRIVLPKDLRERLGLDSGTEVTVREEEGRAVVEPEESADEIICDLENRIEEAASRRERPHYDDVEGEARDHLETIRRQASDSDEIEDVSDETATDADDGTPNEER
ncbi:AbrB/MazE/SpoVT family DNA-binding domain-containing protein [Halorussus gelatinilyticus]|uniref:AbrB/MazE/SpoVT family DNA-binding domain-containing protein n=1 Tax=Halorussus gelatinilyticus TaxID=2937524 RepID=A0A8U0INN8_9EURY|nr:AbrB/MazE/SpoVT family DNA-binding domain-containing protein [Halorussus gelatinilyticus]UPW02072.1 AbrB/MazE/SpoVT family DNA-binding domain-containing protein [Halorussus gelatinilyticus]